MYEEENVSDYVLILEHIAVYLQLLLYQAYYTGTQHAKG